MKQRNERMPRTTYENGIKVDNKVLVRSDVTKKKKKKNKLGLKINRN